jgi:hypothetical protein
VFRSCSLSLLDSSSLKRLTSSSLPIQMPRSSRSAAAAAGSSEALDKAIHEMADTVVAATTTTEAAAAAGTTTPTPKKKRLCRHPGCTKVIKSQGFCQRHGAKAKRCKIEGCDKQAQGTHDGKSLLIVRLPEHHAMGQKRSTKI